jgi:hypothetical protein
VKRRLALTAAIGLFTMGTACSVTRPVPASVDATALRTYLTEHPPTNLRIMERSGRRYWVHAPEVRGDSLVGRHGYNLPVRPLGVPLEEVAELRTGHLSVGRTGALVGGVLAGAVLALSLLVKEAQPIH